MRITACGCALLDYLYQPIDFGAPVILKYTSRQPGDGGLLPGRLVFLSQLARFSGMDAADIVRELTGGMPPASTNVGGPAIVALATAAQLLAGAGHACEYHGVRGDDATGAEILARLAGLPLALEHYAVRPGASPSTVVLSDPSHGGGHGERTFINDLAVAEHFAPADLAAPFFDAGLVCFGATALVPGLHRNLAGLLRRARAAGAFTLVTTVYDFLNEQRHPGQPWPLGEDGDSWPLIDLLVADAEEALRLTGTARLEDAMAALVRRGPAAFIITHGTRPVIFHAHPGGRVAATPQGELPISQTALEDAAGCARGDTTGCGDNFAGGVLASLALQLQAGGAGAISLPAAVALGVCAGGAARHRMGGLDPDNAAVRAAITRLYRAYRGQVAGLQAGAGLPELPGE